MALHWELAEIELRFPGVRTLKEKRARLRPLVDRLRSRFPVSVAETGQQDTLQRGEIGVVMVASDRAALDRVFRAIGEMLDVQDGWETVRYDRDGE